MLQTYKIVGCCVLETQRPLKSTVLGGSTPAGARFLPKRDILSFENKIHVVVLQTHNIYDFCGVNTHNLLLAVKRVFQIKFDILR